MARTINKNVKNLKVELLNKNFKCLIGSTKPDSADIFYVKVSFWCKHSDDIKNYKNNLNTLEKQIKNKLIAECKGVFENRLLFQLNAKKTLIKPDDIFYTYFETTLKQLPQNDKTIFDLKADVELFINNLIEKIIYNNKFEFYYNKKGNYIE